ncbi:Uncharacterised protein [Bordetella pertussis]|nr:Uncharacterised protein [Bordetella pertussis]CFP71340.1 Uncharacterised protein [Bordetella pertussis]
MSSSRLRWLSWRAAPASRRQVARSWLVSPLLQRCTSIWYWLWPEPVPAACAPKAIRLPAPSARAPHHRWIRIFDMFRSLK